MKLVSWLFFRIRVPETWEMSRYSLTRPSGHAVFSDDLAERLHFSWQQTAELSSGGTDHDVRQRLQAVRRELDRPKLDVVPGPIETVVPAWLGFRVTGARDALVAARYLAGEEEQYYLLEAEFNLADQSVQTAFDVLKSAAAREKDVWCAYHLDLVLPDSWELTDAHIYPGSSELEFQCGAEILQLFSVNPKTTDQMPENMIGKLMHAKERIVERTTRRVGPHEAVYIETKRLAGRGFVGRLKRVHDHYAYTGWDCPNRKSPRRFLVRYRRQSPGVPIPDDLNFRCCQ